MENGTKFLDDLHHLNLLERNNDRRLQPDFVKRVVRSRDLVNLLVAGFDAEITTGPNPYIRAKKTAQSASFAVLFNYQHSAEFAVYEGKPDHVPPTPHIPARTSRLIFELPKDYKIEFSSSGILKAMGELKMRVHPLARPKSISIRPLNKNYEVLQLPGDVDALVSENDLIIEKKRRRSKAKAASIQQLGRNLSRIRQIASSRAIRTGKIDKGSKIPRQINKSTEDNIFFKQPLASDFATPPGKFRKPKYSRPPEALETAIEAPYRLLVSPSNRGGWAHANNPVVSQEDDQHIELWHSRLGVRDTSTPAVTTDERNSSQKILRAVWARDREAIPNWKLSTLPESIGPFRMSLNPNDRHMLVRQSSEYIKGRRSLIAPEPVDVNQLYLSGLGAWLDLHGQWQTKPYSKIGLTTILLWEHIAPMGRDQYVKVVYPGYLCPFGHKAVLVKLTERKVISASNPLAGLYQRMFLVCTEPVKAYNFNDLPFVEVRIRPLETPTIDEVTQDQQNSHFVPKINGQPFPFILDTFDKEGRPIHLTTPLLWVAESYSDFVDVDSTYQGLSFRHIPASGQDVAFAQSDSGGDTTVATQNISLLSKASAGTSVPRMDVAEVVLKAVEQLSPVGTVDIQYTDQFKSNAFDSTANPGQVWAKLKGNAEKLDFGADGAGSSGSGGFIAPSLQIAGLSRSHGTVGEIDKLTQGEFDPAEFLQGALPKLFGIVDLIDLLDLDADSLADAPNVVSKALDKIEAFIATLERIYASAQEAIAEAEKLVDRAQTKTAEIQQRAEDTLNAVEDFATNIQTRVQSVLDVITDLFSDPPDNLEEVEDVLEAPIEQLRLMIGDIRTIAAQLPPLIRRQLLNLADELDEAAGDADRIADLLLKAFRFINGIANGEAEVSFGYEWKPKLQSWPGDPPNALIELKRDSIVISVSGKAKSDGTASAEVMAELKDFALVLFPGEPLTRFSFEHLSFRGGSTAKPEVDCVFGEIEFLGALSFIERIKDLIPFDGFSDPPYVDVTPGGVVAGFTLELPNIAVGVFALSNMSLGADVKVPFLGEAVTVGFSFCSRERPFTLQVTFIGGGGWFLMRLAPDGLQVLELGLEAGATLSVDFGVASGSISAMIGIYMRLEGDQGSLTGYFRLRGEVDVLGLISASIELYLALAYHFDTGKMIGEAQLTIKVKVFFFSASVTIRAQRQFSGSNGDPGFADLMIENDQTAPAWSQYCAAFGGEL